MKILIIKTSSLGDVLHTFPALTDAGRVFPQIQFDWVIEEAFAEVPAWHPLVRKIIPLALRRWRKKPVKTLQCGEWQAFYKQLQAEKYDYVIDAQGLIKSAFVTFFARGLRCGLDWHSAWEPLASLIYQRKCAVDPKQHAIMRMRQLFAAVLNYDTPKKFPDYGLDRTHFIDNKKDKACFIFLHGTTWSTKHYPENYWRELAQLVTTAGHCIKLPWGNTIEYERAQRIAQGLPHVEILPRLNLLGIAKILSAAKAAVAVDTGLGHLAAALNVPTLSLYGPTDPTLTGTVGEKQIHLIAQFPCAPCLRKNCHYVGEKIVEPPCFSSLPPDLVWQRLQEIL